MAGEMIRDKRLFEKNAVSGGTGVITATTVTANGLIGNVPAGWTLELVIYNHTGTADATIDLGTAALGNQIVDDEWITNSATTTAQYNYIPNALAAFSVYISSASWVNVSLDVYLLIRKVL